MPVAAPVNAGAFKLGVASVADVARTIPPLPLTAAAKAVTTPVPGLIVVPQEEPVVTCGMPVPAG